MVRETSARDGEWRDDMADCLAEYAVNARVEARDEHHIAAKRVLLDTLAVGLGAFRHPAAAIARSYLRFYPEDPTGVTVWGTGCRTPAPVAALVNGVPLRCYDYNDVLVGRFSSGHPSDMVAPMLAVAEWRGHTGRELLDALAIGYEIASAIYEVAPSEDSGWDHANLSALGATAGLARLLGLNTEQAAEAFGIVAVQHIQSNEIESSAPNKRGDLTMWKRFHGADIMRYALDACLLAASGAEGPVRPFQGELGFLKIFKVPNNPVPVLSARLNGAQAMTAIEGTNLKRWPVGSRGQSAIQAAIEARKQMPEGAEIAAVNVRTEPGVYHHLVEIRSDPWRPKSREAADHSLPYIVGTAVLDGAVTVSSFDLEKVCDPERGAFIADKVNISVNEELGRDGPALNLSEVEIVTASGEQYTARARVAAGHHLNPFSIADLADKLHENASGILPSERLDQIVDTVSTLESSGTIRTLTGLLAGENEL